jgi:hypothetical protein
MAGGSAAVTLARERCTGDGGWAGVEGLGRRREEKVGRRPKCVGGSRA